MDGDYYAVRLNEFLGRGSKTADLDFKSEFNPNSNPDWPELIKDIVAIANSGGGIIAIGLNDDGSTASYDIQPVLDLDPADISNKVQKYTNCCFADFRMVETKIGGKSAACLAIGGVHNPIVFEKPGTYQIVGTNQQKSAFSQGTVYFRHGAKSEPGTSDDLRNFVEREVERLRSAWLDNIRKVVEAPTGSKVLVVPVGGPGANTDEVRGVRLTMSPEAPLVRELDPNKTHPYRQKEVAQRLTEKLGQGNSVKGHDVFAIRRAHGIDDQPHYCYRPTFSSPQFSEAFVDWIASECKVNPEFVESARQHLKKLSGDSQVPPSSDERLRWLDSFMRKHGHSQAAIARMLKLNPSTISLVLRGSYDGNVESVLQRIEILRRDQK